MSGLLGIGNQMSDIYPGMKNGHLANNIFTSRQALHTNIHQEYPSWGLCAFFPVFYVPFYMKREKLDNFMCLLIFECTKRLKAHSQAIPGQALNDNTIWPVLDCETSPQFIIQYGQF